MKIDKVHCLFEQSGTFKRAFLRLGIDSIDYDLQNDYGETDVIIDLFQEIEKAHNNEVSIFSWFEPTNLVLAFFPCTRFEPQAQMLFYGSQYQMKDKPLLDKVELARKSHDELNHYYKHLCMLVEVCLKKGLRLVIENPCSQPHYLTNYFPIRPNWCDWDRRKLGDYFKKPTQYFCVNCELENNLLTWDIKDHQANFAIDGKKYKQECSKFSDLAKDRQTARSMIHPDYAENFIKLKLLDSDTDYINEFFLF